MLFMLVTGNTVDMDEIANIPKLKDAVTYRLWRAELDIWFTCQSLTDVVEGTYTREHALVVSTAEEKRWVVQDAKAKKAMLNTMDTSLKEHILHLTTSRAMWTKLRSMFQNDSAQLKDKLMQDLYEFKYNDSKSVLENISLIQTCAQQLNALQVPISDAMIVSKILNVLPRKFSNFQTAWESTASVERTLERLCVRLQSEEHRCNYDQPSTSSVAFHAQGQNLGRTTRCFLCNDIGHIRRNCPRNNVSSHEARPHKSCDNCGRNHGGKCWRPKNSKPYNRNSGKKTYNTYKEACKTCGYYNHLSKDCALLKEQLAAMKLAQTKQSNESPSSHDSKNSNQGPQKKFYESQNRTWKRNEGQGRKISFHASNENKQVSANFQTNTGSSKPGSETGSSKPVRENVKKRRLKETNSGSSKPDCLIGEKMLGKKFIVDSGANCHMTNSETALTNVTQSVEIINTAKKGGNMSSLGIGNIDSRECELTNVHFIPELNRNLLSVNRVTENFGAAYFDNTGVKILREKLHIPEEAVILDGEKTDNGLFEVTLTPIVEANYVKPKSQLEEWHRKMGHLGLTNLMKLPSMAKGVRFNKEDLDSCHICSYAKQTKKPHSTVRRRATRPLELIHTDVCGPVQPLTHDRKRFFVTFLDDFTHYCEVYLMEAKSETFAFLKEFVTSSSIFHGLKVHKIRCDNGGEYTSLELRGWCRENGIKLDYTVPGCPELNGKAERLNRVLVERARAMLFDSKLNEYMWGEAILASAYVINRSPSVTVSRLPAELWFGVEQDLSNIEIFGVPVTATILTHLPKFKFRAREAYLVGYGENCYRLWDPREHEIFMSRDVEVHDHDFLIPEEQPGRQIGTRVNLHIENENEENPETQDETILYEPNDSEGEEVHNPRYGLRRRDNIRRPRRFDDYETNMCFGSESLTYDECLSDPDWRKAIDEEKTSLRENKVWEVKKATDAVGKEIIETRWIFTVKSDGRKKARLVAKGYQQRMHEFDQTDIFSPVVDTTNLRILFSLAALNGLIYSSFDVKTAFLNGTVEQEIYMKMPEGYPEQDKVCLLKKALYGLKQAPQRWYKRLSSFLAEIGLRQLVNDKCIYTTEDTQLTLAIHVDDGIIFSSSQEQMNMLIQKLQGEFDIKVTLDPKLYLGIQIQRTNHGIFLYQADYTRAILKRFKMENCNPQSTPMVPRSNKSPQMLHLDRDDDFPYCQAVGSLQYLASKTRPDIAFATNFSSRYMSNPSPVNISDVKRTFRYLKGTINHGLFLPSVNTQDIVCFTDSDFAGSGPEFKLKSTSGNLILLGGGPVSWLAKKQDNVATSVCEAEYVAASICCRNLQYIKSFIYELSSDDLSATICIDNQGALRLIKTGQMHSGSKHIQVKFHYISEALEKGLFKIEYCPTEENLADIFTKALTTEKFQYLSNKICVCL